MSETTFDIIATALDYLGALEGGTATGGTTSTLVDSARGGRQDDWNGGTAFIERDAGGAGGVPEKEFSLISDYSKVTGTFTTVWTTAPASGDIYSVATKEWSLDDMRRIVNRALRKMGRVPLPDESLTTAAGKRDYTLPAAVKGNLRRVFLLPDSNANDRRPYEMSDWYTVPRAAGTAEGLVFRSQPETGAVIRLIYMGIHDKLWLATDKLSEYVELERVVAETVYLALRWRKRRGTGMSKEAREDMAEAKGELQDARKRNRILDPGYPAKSILTSDGARGTKYGPWLND